MTKPIRLLILILSHDQGSFADIQTNGQDKTFIPVANENCTVLRYVGQKTKPTLMFRLIFAFRRLQYDVLLNYSNYWPFGFLGRVFADMRIFDKSTKSILRRNNLRTTEVSYGSGQPRKVVTQVPEDWSLIGLKTIEAFKYVVENYDFDFLFRTNTSSYVDANALLEHLSSQPKEGLYAGVIDHVFRTKEFASGAGILMSRDVVKRVCEKESDWKHGLADDVALAEIVKSLDGPRVHLTESSRLDVLTLEKAKNLGIREIQDNFHFRCKATSPQETIDIMKHLHLMKQKLV